MDLKLNELKPAVTIGYYGTSRMKVYALTKNSDEKSCRWFLQGHSTQAHSLRDRASHTTANRGVSTTQGHQQQDADSR